MKRMIFANFSDISDDRPSDYSEFFKQHKLQFETGSMSFSKTTDLYRGM